jgi:hypothetical protein
MSCLIGPVEVTRQLPEPGDKRGVVSCPGPELQYTGVRLRRVAALLVSHNPGSNILSRPQVLICAKTV